MPLLIHIITFSSPKIFSEYCGSLLINYNALLCNFHSIICEVVAYGRLKSKENFKLLALKVVAINYKRWSLIRGFKYRFDLETFEHLTEKRSKVVFVSSVVNTQVWYFGKVSWPRTESKSAEKFTGKCVESAVIVVALQ